MPALLVSLQPSACPPALPLSLPVITHIYPTQYRIYHPKTSLILASTSSVAGDGVHLTSQVKGSLRSQVLGCFCHSCLDWFHICTLTASGPLGYPEHSIRALHLPSSLPGCAGTYITHHLPAQDTDLPKKGIKAHLSQGVVTILGLDLSPCLPTWKAQAQSSVLLLSTTQPSLVSSASLGLQFYPPDSQT